MTFKEVPTKTGRVLYYMNGKLVSKATYDEYKDIVTVDPLLETESNETQAERKCIFCGSRGDSTRYVNRQTVYLCEDDYMVRTIGEVAEQLRKANGS